MATYSKFELVRKSVWQIYGINIALLNNKNKSIFYCVTTHVVYHLQYNHYRNSRRQLVEPCVIRAMCRKRSEVVFIIQNGYLLFTKHSNSQYKWQLICRLYNIIYFSSANIPTNVNTYTICNFLMNKTWYHLIQKLQHGNVI